ncbi:MAG: hypothetical protein I3273_00195 [Candidatus Moeniiplasma glomeromycotorum]|nr:hypothetical protein [Candidatus Moeniiplasma glomeromycotorum]MCE8167451.1 hypothetical protein [Candidatus Moeniiplasma glomeromycotorum]MCE8168535.1 hypothetical protein [Candidatus Moeniiplasma glomeromycotorum]
MTNWKNTHDNKCKKYKWGEETLICLSDNFISHSSFCKNERNFNKRHGDKKIVWDERLQGWLTVDKSD